MFCGGVISGDVTGFVGADTGKRGEHPLCDVRNNQFASTVIYSYGITGFSQGGTSPNGQGQDTVLRDEGHPLQIAPDFAVGKYRAPHGNKKQAGGLTAGLRHECAAGDRGHGDW